MSSSATIPAADDRSGEGHETFGFPEVPALDYLNHDQKRTAQLIVAGIAEVSHCGARYSAP